MKAMVTCGRCGQFRRNHGRGLCSTCWRREHRAGRIIPAPRKRRPEPPEPARLGGEDWRDLAACAAPGADPRWFSDPDLYVLGLAACSRCPVVAECDAWARSEPFFAGVAGGRVIAGERVSA